MKYAEVILAINNKNVNRVFNYSVPEHIKDKIQLGMRVFVPFGGGNRLREAFVVGFSNISEVKEDLVKEIYSLPDEYPIFTENMINLAKFMEKEYYANLSECLKCIMPKVVNDKKFKYVKLNSNFENIQEIEDIIKKENSQSKVLKYLKQNDGLGFYTRILSELKISASPIKSLENKGLISVYFEEFKQDIYNFQDFEKDYALKKNKEQEEAFNFIKQRLDNLEKKPILIHGVTGSGKTEVYLQIIEEVLKKGQQAIVLVPEISLTPQTVKRFIERFGSLVSVTHSRLNSSERFDQWKKARTKEISIMIGARSAIFTPFPNLGIIIIDEEHESSYKSESTPKYVTSEVAEEISKLTGATVLLGSATPSIESYYKVKKGEYDLVNIKNRVNLSFPDIEIVDMRKELSAGNKSIFSRELFKSIRENLQNNMQTILFLNRRGHSTFVSCRSCGYVMGCKYCNVNYTYHSYTSMLNCHYCNSGEIVPKYCPECGSNYIKFFGVGTQKIEQEIKKFFPKARVMRMDLDTTSHKNSHAEILEKFNRHEADILIGTQMIAKGLHFPRVSLVGIVSADTTINSGDYRSSEVSFQLLTQVAGRAGRENFKGKVFIQTYEPEHYSIVLAKENDYVKFYEKEILEREIGFYPPFSNIFFIMITGEDEKKVLKVIYKLEEILRYYNKKVNFQISEPAKAAVSRIKNQYRYKILIKAKDKEKLKSFVLYCIERLEAHININDINISLNLNPNYMV